MVTVHCRKSLLLAIGVLVFSFSSASAAAPPTGLVPLPTCGSDPSANTRMLQAAIDAAPDNSTLVFSPGVCVVAKCDIAQGRICYGPSGQRHFSALHIGERSQLTLVGAADGTSVLKLDPNPPGSPGHHAYCGDTHVLSIQLSTFITLRDFIIDGSDSELPHDHNQCPPNPRLGTHSGAIDEHLHDVRVLNATDVTIDHMQLTEAHGDGLNLAAEHNQAIIPNTERITVTNTNFLADDRSGIAFQRNVGFVTIADNYFRNSGNDQDLDMEPSGGPDDLGPYAIDINHNLFERLQPKITVTLGSAGGVQPSRGIRFTYNTIKASPLAEPQTGQGGCIFVYTANETTIAHNKVIGAQGCVTIAAQKVTGLRVEDNRLESFVNVQNAVNKFVPRPVIDVSERVVNRGDTTVCGLAPKPPCPYFIHYPDRISIARNVLLQHVQRSPGIRVSNGDHLLLANNTVLSTQKVAPIGAVDPTARAVGIDTPFGVRDLPSYGYYENEKRGFRQWSVTGNAIKDFADGFHSTPIKARVLLSTAALNGNLFNTALPKPRGIFLEGVASAPQVGFITSLVVNQNLFGCGFPSFPPLIPLPRNAYVRPSGQTQTGNIGVVIPCQ